MRYRGRVKFYSVYDLSAGHFLDRIFTLIQAFNDSKALNDVNDAIEYYNVIQFIDGKMWHRDWPKEFIERCSELGSKLYEKVARFFASISTESFQEISSAVDKFYSDDYIYLLSKFNCHLKISEEAFCNTLDNFSLPIRRVLADEKLTKYYSQTIHKFLLSNTEFAEIILQKYEVKGSEMTKKSIYLPQSFTDEVICGYMESYVKFEKANPNYIALIANSMNLILPPQLKLLAKKRYEEFTEHLFQDGAGLSISYEVRLSDVQDEPVSISGKNGNTLVSYRTQWFDENLDFPTLLNNFIYLFGYTDLNFRISLISLKAEMGVFERLVGVKAKNDYLHGISFNNKEALSFLSLVAYYNYLFSKGIRLEKVIEWFFHDYLKNEFEINNFIFSFPGENYTYQDKCNLLLTQMEVALKQIGQLAEFGCINEELLFYSSTPVTVSTIFSQLPTKYVYAKPDKLGTVFFHFFSDQSGLSYLENEKKEYSTLYELLTKSTMPYNEIPEYNRGTIDHYVKAGLLKLEDTHIKIARPLCIHILYDLHYKEVINYYRVPSSWKAEIDRLLQQEDLFIGNTFFSNGEQDYFDFYLNKSKFGNGYDLRNKYIQLGQTSEKDDERTHQNNYMKIIKLIVLIIIKLNDELCLKSDE